MEAVVTKMPLSQIKQTANKNLRSKYVFAKDTTAIGIVAIQDVTQRDFVLAGMSAIGMAAIVLGKGSDTESINNIVFVDTIHQNDLLGFDFFVFDNEHESVDVVAYMKAGIVPIMPEKNVFSGMLRDFNPMKFEGNGFFFKSENPYRIFEKIVAYTENVKFPEDRRVLLKNVVGAF